MVAHRNSADSKPFLAIEPRKGEMPDPTPASAGRAYQCPPLASGQCGTDTPLRSRQPRAPMTPRPDSSIAAARIAAAGHRRIPRMGSGETWQKRASWTLSRLEVLLLLARCDCNSFSDRQARQYVSAMHSTEAGATATRVRDALSTVRRRQDFAVGRSWAASRGNILARCVLGRLAVAIFSLHASPKGLRTGKAPLPGNISPPCIQNELALAGFARHVSEKRCKSPLEDTPRAYLAREGRFSLHGPPESYMGRESCYRSRLSGKGSERTGKSRRSAPERKRIRPSQNADVLAKTNQKGKI